MAPPSSSLRTAPLGHWEKRTWTPRLSGIGSRRQRKGGPYEAFVPATIAERRFSLDEDAVAAIASASKALGELNSSRPRLTSLNALATNLLRSESAASSRIEGIAISHKRLARAAYEGAARRRGDNKAAEVLGNVEAMKRAIDLGIAGETISVDDICDVHRTLLRFTADRKIAGMVRREQNWIGGNELSPVGAAYVPPPPEQVPALMEDLCRFLLRDDMAPIAQAAIAHAQFENIHPFADGNGRVGRALIYCALRRGGEATTYIPPISLVLAAEQRTYIGGFGAYSAGDVSAWCEIFASATERAAREAERLADEIDKRQEMWLERLGRPRKDAVVRRLIATLPEHPVIDVPAGQRLSGRSHVAVGKAIQQLERAGILRRLNERKWGRVWECDELLKLVEDFEKTVSAG